MNRDETRIVDSVDPSEIERIAVAATKIPSFPVPPGNEQEAALFFADELRSLGVDVELQEVEPSRPNVIARLPGSGQGKTILFNGHIDTSAPIMGWIHDPFGGIVEGGRLFGHGIANMKASDAAMIGAMAALKEAGVELAGDVVVSLVMGECTGGTGTRYMVNRGIEADYFVNGEPTDLQVLTFSSGSCRLQIIVTGRASHYAAEDKSKGINAIVKMMKILGRLGESLGPADWIRKLSDKPEHQGLPRYNLGAIRGGMSRDMVEWGAYTVPDYSVATLDIRFPPGISLEMIKEDLEARISEVADADGDIRASVELMLDWCMPPYEAAVDDPMVSIMAESVSAICGATPRVGALVPLKFMGADSGTLQEAGIPGVICGVGDYTGFAEESVELSKIIDLTKSYALAAYRVAGAPVEA